MWEKSTRIEVCENFDDNQNVMFGLSPPYGKGQKPKNDK